MLWSLLFLIHLTVASTSFRPGSRLIHLAVDDVTGSVYVGAVNHVYQLDSDSLRLVEDVLTGPVADNRYCYSPDTFGHSPRCNSSATMTSLETKMTNNFNQILVINNETRQLVTCGSVFQGTCQIRQLTNISWSSSYVGKSAARNLFVASNDPAEPSVAFIGPGPPNSQNGQNNDPVLYVASVFTGDTSKDTEYLIRQFSTGIVSRWLTGPETLDIRYKKPDDTGAVVGTFAVLTYEAVTKHKVKYAAGFSVKGYSYFLTIQPVSYAVGGAGPSSRASKIVQICQNDLNYDSYVEMPLVCASSTHGNFTQVRAGTFLSPGVILAEKLDMSADDQLLLAAFSLPGGADGDAKSALCMYKLSDIQRTAANNVRRCYQTQTDYIGQQFYRPGPVSPNCTAVSQITINDSYCGQTHFNAIRRNSPLSGQIPLESSPAVVIHGRDITAVSALVVDSHTIAFVGTTDGYVIKILLNNEHNPVFDEIAVGTDGFPVSQDMMMSSDKQHLYVMTNSTVYKMPVAECERFTTCGSCLAANSTLCGWCTLKARCVSRSQCPSSELPARWQSRLSSSSYCTAMTDVRPSRHLSVTKALNISLHFVELPLPQPTETYMCVFGSNESYSMALVSINLIICHDFQGKPIAIHRQDHVNISLSVQVLPSAVDFIHTQLTFYNCNIHTSCTPCTSSSWGCFWCVTDNKCIDEAELCTSTSISQTQMCPLVASKSDVLIESGSLFRIPVTISNLPVIQRAGARFFCILHQMSYNVTLSAQVADNSTLLCEDFQFKSSEQVTESSVIVGWSNDRFIIEGTATFTVYNCSALSNNDDCSTCLSLQYSASTMKYNCRWCGNTCKNSTTCDSSTHQSCPTPRIKSIYPHSGPIEGGTRVTFTGTNLGYRFNHSTITIAGITCNVLNDNYIVSSRVVCITGRAHSPTVSDIHVTINGNKAVFNNDLDQKFHYKNPQLDSIYPMKGPIAGGTKVTLIGHQLDTGANQVIWFGTQKLDVVQVDDRQLVFVTVPVQNVTSVRSINVTFDNASRHLDDVLYEFVNNPVVSTVTPMSSFHNGGCRITVMGTHLGSALTTYLQLVGDTETFQLPPLTMSATQLIFLSPFVHSSTLLPTHFNLSLHMDGVESVRMLPEQFAMFTVHDNPSVNSFSNGKKEYRGEILTIQGSGLQTSCMNDINEVSVYVGTEPCNITLITNTDLQCKPPDKQPHGYNADGKLVDSELPRVYIKVGNLSYEIGSLQYVHTAPGPAQISGWWPIIVGVCGGILVVVIVILAVIFVRKSSYNERQYRRLQSQLDALESSVRNECKQAFAELQTEVSDIASDLGEVGVPFWDYDTYAAKLLLYVNADYRTMHQTSSINKYGALTHKMDKFNHLLSSKFFLLVFIQTLEQQKEFGMMDRAKVASLLMVTLMDDMPYATEVIKVLLCRLIDKSVEKKTHKLMLRRTEFVVEKLLAHWLSLCMYHCIRFGPTGRTLFRLFQAIKRQTEKGPVDVVTGEARYCLTEDRLLRENVQHNILTVTVQSGDTDQSGGSSCKMLDCDTISQAKAKALDTLYANIPFSCRASVNDIDLFWKSGKHGRLPLRDEDLTTRSVDGWKRVNTLAHYHVKDDSVFIVDITQNHMTDPTSESPVMRPICGGLELDPGVSTLRPIRLENASPDRIWHITRHDDNGVTGNSRSPKVISEIFLTRLLSTKMTLQSFIDELFDSLMFVDSSLCLPVKYIFDVFDTAASRHSITDPEVVHAWKSNSLPLRFWVNIIKNPEFVFDIDKSPVVDSCLSVIAQTLMDSCSMHEHRLGKDSPSTKLLFAKDIPRYRQNVAQFYSNIQQMAPVSEEDMKQYMIGVSKANVSHFNQQMALEQLYHYAHKFSPELIKALDSDPSAKSMQLARRYQDVDSMDDDVTSDDVLLSFV